MMGLILKAHHVRSWRSCPASKLRSFPFSGEPQQTSSISRVVYLNSQRCWCDQLPGCVIKRKSNIESKSEVTHLNVARNGPSTLTSLIPSGISRSHSFQLSRSTLSSSSRIDKCNWGLFSYEEKLPRVGLFWYTGERKMDGSLELPDIIMCSGEGKLVNTSFSGYLSWTILAY